MNRNAGKCPICGKDNGCGVNAGKDPSTCWCMTSKIPAELRRIAHEVGDGTSCICKECVDKFFQGTLITKK